MSITPQTIGILGGMGPNASADFLHRILRISAKKFNAVQDDEYPPIIMNSIGLQGFNVTGITDMQLVERQLVNGVGLLEKAGASVIAIPCNTVHCCFAVMQSAVDIPILNIASVAAQSAYEFGSKVIGLCSSVTTIETKLYESSCAELGIQTLVPCASDQLIVNSIIEAVMGGRSTDEELLQLKSVILKLKSLGADGVILGCTELPLVLNQKWTDVPLFDSLEALAVAVTRFAYGR